MNRTTKLLGVISIIVCSWFYMSDGYDSYPFYGDSMGYYMYLPTTFIYHSHKALDWLPEDKHFDYSIHNYLRSLREGGEWSAKGFLVNKYTYGVAAMELPFFVIAHIYEKLTGGEANGYSASYRYMLKTSSIVYGILGILLLYRVLTSFFDKDTATRTVLVLLMGTNLFWFVFFQAGMAHVPLFFLYTLLLYLTIRLHKQPTMMRFVLTGLCAGLITIIRPVDILCLLIPLLYQVYSKESFRAKLAFIKTNVKGVLSGCFAFILPLLPQILYWKMLTGSYVYYSYGEESFHWLLPKILEGIFSFSNGWLIYSPVMVFSLIGIFLYRLQKPVIWIVLTLLPMYVYIIYCWHTPTYINGLGSRPMIHMYPLLAIPLGAFIKYFSKKGVAPKLVVSLFFFFFIALNISYSIQSSRGVLVSEESNAAYNLRMLFRLRPRYEDLVTYDVPHCQPDYGQLKKVATLVCNDYEHMEFSHCETDTSGRGKYVYHMAADEEYHPGTIKVLYSKERFRDATWLKCSGYFLCTKQYQYYKHLLTLGIQRNEETICWNGLKIDNKIGLGGVYDSRKNYSLNHMLLNSWGYVYYFVKIPDNIHDGDKITLDVWNIGKQDLYIDNLCLELYRDKE